jgi:hypothetical protein
MIRSYPSNIYFPWCKIMRRRYYRTLFCLSNISTESSLIKRKPTFLLWLKSTICILSSSSEWKTRLFRNVLIIILFIILYLDSVWQIKFGFPLWAIVFIVFLSIYSTFSFISVVFNWTSIFFFLCVSWSAVSLFLGI